MQKNKQTSQSSVIEDNRIALIFSKYYLTTYKFGSIFDR